ncbi:MAG: stage 0 sporulation family protein [Candidatus Gastranaerophilaceae bacterium]
MTKFAVKLLKNKYYPLQIPDSVEVQHGQYVLIRTEKGEEAAKVFAVSPQIAVIWEKHKPEVLPLVRVMTEEDLVMLDKLRDEENEAYKICQGFIKKLHLVMNLIDCKYTFDKKKLSFYYTAPERVDFRNLLKELTQVFKRVRIDLRHIGVRDETSLCQGCGICGQPYCCCSFKRQFESININLVTEQGLPITPGKISGTCGRLLCCLNYEYSNYIEEAKKMPPIGSGVMTPDGLGCVAAVNLLSGKVSVKLQDEKTKTYKQDEIEMIDADLNIKIDKPLQYAAEEEEDVSSADIKQLEDDKNSSTGNV